MFSYMYTVVIEKFIYINMRLRFLFESLRKIDCVVSTWVSCDYNGPTAVRVDFKEEFY